ncbi:cAMP-specific 3',5'-cyclic phosphodiesterase 4D isoform X2 [Silurus meridionalis]|nr:cAMP-specific 3',5'-cyclic phosphodiesterase 4D isoform X2 [Silurus meridionalis]
MNEMQEEDSCVMAAHAMKLKSRSSGGSPCETPNSKQSPRNSPRNSPLLFRKLLMNRSIVLQRRFTLAHTPRYWLAGVLWLPLSFDLKYVGPLFRSASHCQSASAYQATLSITRKLTDTRLCGVA